MRDALSTLPAVAFLDLASDFTLQHSNDDVEHRRPSSSEPQCAYGPNRLVVSLDWLADARRLEESPASFCAVCTMIMNNPPLLVHSLRRTTPERCENVKPGYDGGGVGLALLHWTTGDKTRIRRAWCFISFQPHAAPRARRYATLPAMILPSSTNQSPSFVSFLFPTNPSSSLPILAIPALFTLEFGGYGTSTYQAFRIPMPIIVVRAMWSCRVPHQTILAVNRVDTKDVLITDDELTLFSSKKDWQYGRAVRVGKAGRERRCASLASSTTGGMLLVAYRVQHHITPHIRKVFRLEATALVFGGVRRARREVRTVEDRGVEEAEAVVEEEHPRQPLHHKRDFHSQARTLSDSSAPRTSLVLKYVFRNLEGGSLWPRYDWLFMLRCHTEYEYESPMASRLTMNKVGAHKFARAWTARVSPSPHVPPSARVSWGILSTPAFHDVVYFRNHSPPTRSVTRAGYPISPIPFERFFKAVITHVHYERAVYVVGSF
ncbi:hypothetical protein BC629DRAFT_1437291 [Irpex lacteus]|nr:hypothetical protein BC629DRAFT_1437291 [Irpex lacteus]